MFKESSPIAQAHLHVGVDFSNGHSLNGHSLMFSKEESEKESGGFYVIGRVSKHFMKLYFSPKRSLKHLQ